jgi:bifunctional DNase/RNase
MRYKTIRILSIIILILLFLSILLNIYSFRNNNNINIISSNIGKILKLNISEDPLSTQDYVKANVSVVLSNFFVTYNCKSILMTTTEQQALSIQKGIDKNIEVRPWTHDLIKSILDFFNINVLMIKIHDVNNEGIYYTNIYLRESNKTLSLDSRPSDAIALALRTNAPIYVRKDLIEKYGLKSC